MQEQSPTVMVFQSCHPIICNYPFGVVYVYPDKTVIDVDAEIGVEHSSKRNTPSNQPSHTLLKLENYRPFAPYREIIDEKLINDAMHIAYRSSYHGGLEGADTVISSIILRRGHTFESDDDDS
jgi:hypothetical protein